MTAWAKRGARVGLLLGLALAVACGFLWWTRGSRQPGAPTPGAGEDPPPLADQDPRLTFATPYRNVHPDVRYVGDESCAECHPGQAETFRHHPMARTLALVSRPGATERYDRAAHNPFQASGFEFSVARRGERVLHRMVRRDPQGRAVSELEEEALLALGSGRQGYSYVLNHDDYLFHSTIGWYEQPGVWDLAPESKNYYPRTSPISVRCLFCHANEVRWVEHTLNHFQEPQLHSRGIGCERCHGPGELHVAKRQRGEIVEGPDVTIVNPRHLAPALREAVCQQCHLRGQSMLLRRGRHPFDFRPGLPLQLFWAVFVRRPERIDGRKLGHVEQMYLSRCFQQSEGKMGCISCHDPHVLPAPAERVAHFRDRCLACHAETSCSMAVSVRRAQQKEDDCTACHMPPLARAGFSHEAVADHRILRRPQGSERSAVRPPSVASQEMPVISFYPDRRDLKDKDAARDLGVALAEFAWEESIPYPEVFCRWALPLLETALEAWPDDVAGWEAKGFALAQLGRGVDAQAAFRSALALAPNRERTLAFAAQQAQLLGHGAEARAFWRRALAVNPWMRDYHYQLAKVLGEDGAWSEALKECEAALARDPASEETRVLLITCCIRSGAKARAQREFEVLLALGPKDPDVLRRWFTEQVQ